MSPTENDLRAFLRDGEGDVPDAVSVITKAMRVREIRRKRFTTALTTAAAAVVVIGGSTLLIKAGGNSDESSGANAGGGGIMAAPHAATSNDAGPAAGTARRSASRSTASKFSAENTLPGPKNGADVGLPMCAASPTEYALPTTAASGKLWSSTPASMRLCGYVNSHRVVQRTLYAAARPAADSLEAASAAPTPNGSCPTESTRPTVTIEIYALDAHDRPLRPSVVLKVSSCGRATVTNGTAARYLGDLPKPLRRLVARALAER